VVGSEKQVVVNGKAVIGRKTRWGAVVVEDENHCEFIHLRNFLTRTHLQDLVETTAMVHYETFRSEQLMALKGAVNPSATANSATTSPTSETPTSVASSSGPVPAKNFPPFA
jgi:septin 3/9/12